MPYYTNFPGEIQLSNVDINGQIGYYLLRLICGKRGKTNLEIICRELEASEFELALAVRITVFVDEQHVPAEEEHDELDAVAVHFGAFHEGALIGTGRVVAMGTTAKIGRVAVLPAYRIQKVGSRLVHAMLRWARNCGLKEAILGAQLQAIGFYERLGFVPEGGVFDDAGIPHRLMRRSLIMRRNGNAENPFPSGVAALRSAGRCQPMSTLISRLYHSRK